ncbi:phage gp6-like head-tail connector protein, partial [Candidatus Pacearchaeota archaeon]|nr:phage gp6-like head-tail connector protein [Candidatus Pacearchaeota archaeon]
MYERYNNNSVAWPYIVTVAPATLPLTVNEVKEHLRIDLDDKTQDALLKVLIRAATDYAEKYTKIDFITRTYETLRDSFIDSLEIRRTPLQ